MKLRYKLDKSGRFIVVKETDVLRPRGYFTVDSSNRLVYVIKEPAEWRRKYGMPDKITLTGKWSLDKNDALKFTLKKTDARAGDEQLLLKSELVKAKADCLIFSLGTQGKAGTHDARLLQLKGKWQADKHNRLQFLVKKTRITSDTLTLQGAWQVKNNALQYTCKKTGLKTKQKKAYTLHFSGYWEINRKNRLTYILDTGKNSYFNFKTFLETPSLIGKKGEIKYRAGIGVKGSREYRPQTITLYGVWKLQRKTGLSFDLDCKDRRAKELRFGAFARTGNNGKVTFSLRSRKGQALGLSVEFSRAFLKDNASWFIRMVEADKKPRFEGGVAIRF